MQLWIRLFAVAALGQLTLALGPNMVCYYDAASDDRQGVGRFTLTDMEMAIQFCTHVVYGYVGINANTFELMSLNPQRDMQRRNFAQFTALKDRYPNIKFLLSVGGDKDDQGDFAKYESLIEADRQKQSKFIESARDILRTYNFDGLDLAFQFRRNKPRKVHGAVGSAFKSFKKWFTGDQIVDERADSHKEQFTALVNDMRAMFRPFDLMLSLTVLPNVNSSWYFNAPAIINSLDYVNLMAFDFTTPERNPEEADHTSPLFAPVPMEGNRLPHYNVDFQLDHWISQRVPHSKVNLGIASFGRAWKLKSDSKSDGVPIISDTDGPAPAGPNTKTPGFLDWPEICEKLPNPSNVGKPGDQAPLRRVGDISHKTGTYAFRPVDSNGDHGMWVSYEDPDTAATKAGYVRSRGFGGVALFDLSLDDFHGRCTGDKFPMLRAIKYKLL